jgi:hypothetical protein
MARRKPLAIGDRVRLRRAAALEPGPRTVTTVEGMFTDVAGGIVLTDRLEGFYCWNVMELERAPRLRSRPVPKVAQ